MLSLGCHPVLAPFGLIDVKGAFEHDAVHVTEVNDFFIRPIDWNSKVTSIILQLTAEITPHTKDDCAENDGNDRDSRKNRWIDTGYDCDTESDLIKKDSMCPSRTRGKFTFRVGYHRLDQLAKFITSEWTGPRPPHPFGEIHGNKKWLWLVSHSDVLESFPHHLRRCVCVLNGGMLC
jgi:hypothetical protein